VRAPAALPVFSTPMGSISSAWTSPSLPSGLLERVYSIVSTNPEVARLEAADLLQAHGVARDAQRARSWTRAFRLKGLCRLRPQVQRITHAR
jgi:hypothetical protein